jgi:hypothetical protein
MDTPAGRLQSDKKATLVPTICYFVNALNDKNILEIEYFKHPQIDQFLVMSSQFVSSS